MVIDSAGYTYVTGLTESPTGTFPILNAFQPVFGGIADAFVTKIGPIGELIYSSYLGGIDDDRGNTIAVDPFGNASTRGDFPTENAFQPDFGGGIDAFVTKINTLSAPTITCSDDLSVANDPGVAGAIINYPPPTINDDL